jgi:hypothetical protein
LIIRAGLCLSIVILGLALRGYGLGVGLPSFVVKYGGSTLWATMVFFLVTLAAPSQSPWTVALMSASIGLAVELFRLVHTPWLDAFRLTIPGALLLGRIFSPWNLLAYGTGITLGTGLDRFAMSAFAKSAVSTRAVTRVETARTDATPPQCGA